ncbi:MAG: hypothetical protein ACOCUH_03705 [Bacteriovoracia bacterium]
MESCKSCNKKQCAKYQNKRRKGKDAYKQILNERSAQIKRKSKYKNIPVSDNLSDLLKSQWLKQNHKCYYTERIMQLHGYHEGKLNAATIDRICPEKGYVEGNVVFCCSFVNRMKQEFSYENLIKFCQELVFFSNKHK